VNRAVLATGGRSCSCLRVAAATWLHSACRTGVRSLLMIAVCSSSCVSATGEAITKPRIAFAGDSIVDNYWSGITRFVETNSCLKDAVEFGRFAHNATGLTRGDRVYWPREIRRIGDSSCRRYPATTVTLKNALGTVRSPRQ
jgi:hypothetical protein